MKMQWVLLLGGLISLIIAIFAIFNVGKVNVNYIIGQGQWPLVLVIFVSALAGVIVSGCFATIKLFEMKIQVKQLQKVLRAKEKQLIEQESNMQVAELDTSKMPSNLTEPPQL